MNRGRLVDSILCGISDAEQHMRDLLEMSLDASDTLTDYDDLGYCKSIARRVRLRAGQAEQMAALLREHAGMLETLSYVEAGADEDEPVPVQTTEAAQ